MQSSRATWILTALCAAALCVETGCVGSRLSKGVGSLQMSRPRLLGRWRDNDETEIASTKPKPPSSAVPPTGLADRRSAGAGARAFPSQPAPGSSGDMPYESTADRGGYNENSIASGGPTSSYDSTRMQPQQGFYNDEMGGSSNAGRFADSAPRGGGGYQDFNRGYDDRSGGYREPYSDTGGAQRDFGSPYAGGGNQYNVADARGSDQYDYQQRGASGESYRNEYPRGGDPRYDVPPANSQYISPQQGGGGYDDNYNPAGESYGNYGADNYNGGGQDYGRISGQDNGGTAGRFDPPTYNSQPGSSGGYNSPGSYGPPSGYGSPSTGASPAGFFPGSTKPYGNQPLTPPTANGYNGGY